MGMANEVDDAMAAIDKDKNGTIDYDEFLMWWDGDQKATNQG